MPRLPEYAQVGVQSKTVEQLVTAVDDITISLGAQGDTILDYIQANHAPPVINGRQLHTQLQSTRVLPIGCSSIDNALVGGFREGHLTELCGESGAGKSQICMMAAAATAARGQLAVYIDTNNAVTGTRLCSMMQNMQSRSVSMEVALGNVHISKAHSPHQLLAVLDSLLSLASTIHTQHQQNQLDTNMDIDNNKTTTTTTTTQQQKQLPKMIIVDSLGSLISPLLGGGGSTHGQGHVLLSMIATTLKTLAQECNAAVLVTNHMVGGGNSNFNTSNNTSNTGGGNTTGGSPYRQQQQQQGRDGIYNAAGSNSAEKRPAMGESWLNQPHLRIKLTPPPDTTLGTPTTTTTNNNTTTLGRNSNRSSSGAGGGGGGIGGEVMEKRVFSAKIAACGQVPRGSEAQFSVAAAGVINLN